MLSEDKQSIERVLSGDSSAFGAIVTRHQRRLLGLLVHACGDCELAEDIAQEAFARAYQKLDMFTGESQFYTWLARIAMNLLFSDRRRKRLENQVSRAALDVALDNDGFTNRRADAAPDRQMELDETQQCVRQAIAMLEEERRAVVILRDFDGLDYESIAETLGIPVGTVRSRLHRARLELRSILQQKAVQLGLSSL
ncbi:MAG: sigma-70 family RNA polymerase sigma factor [Aureliella sp.]